jgi:hypothetical protein
MPIAFGREYYAIVDNFGKKPRMAFMDISLEALPGSVFDFLFDVYDVQGIQLAEFTVRANAYGFASSSSWGNFFNLFSGQPLLVRVRTTESGGQGEATLHLDSMGASTIVAVLPDRRRDGSLFSFGTNFALALGNFQSASLLIANVSGSDVAIDVYKGYSGSIGGGVFTNPHLLNNGIWKVNLTQNEALSDLIVTATGPIIVQAVINDGRAIQSFMVLPWQ